MSHQLVVSTFYFLFNYFIFMVIIFWSSPCRLTSIAAATIVCLFYRLWHNCFCCNTTSGTISAIPYIIFWAVFFFVGLSSVWYIDGGVIAVSAIFVTGGTLLMFSWQILLILFSCAYAHSILVILCHCWHPYPLPSLSCWISFILTSFYISVV